MKTELPQLSAYFQSGGMVDAVLNQGLPAPIDLQVSSSNLDAAFATASDLARGIRGLPGVSDVFIPQDLDYPSLRLDVNREHANELGLNQREVVSNVITALTSNGMIAPSYWVDPKSGNDYMLTVQYPEAQIRNIADLKNNLRAHLERVRAGEELLVKDRNRPLARLVPFVSGEDLDAEEVELAASGLIRLPTWKLPDTFRKMPAPRVSFEDSVSSVVSERDEG